MVYEIVKTNGTRLGLTEACQALGVSRSGYDAWLNREPVQEDTVLLRTIRDIARMPCYGYRRIKETLGKPPYNKAVNRKKVLKIMRENGLLCKRKKAFKPKTTDSEHGLPVYPNLAKDLVVTRPNQLWVADITYVRLLSGFVYLAVIMDVFSRKCIGWKLARGLDASLTLNALRMALKNRQGMDLSCLIHHSDQGVQYACNDYTALLEQNCIQISMSRKGNPYDNAFCESFIKTLKAEEVYLSEYLNFGDALDNIERFIEEVYNRKRLHSSIGYKAPDEFEQQYLSKARA